MSALVVALAGGLGAVARFLVDAAIGRRVARPGLPLGTLVINVTGSLLLGLITGWWSVAGGDPTLRLVLGTGFLGGYTTFSTASVEAARLAREGLQWRAVQIAALMLVTCVLGAFAGFALGVLAGE
ncbi:MAG TPA: fluoride efflux transporter CrcB [Propionibacteriaceae bacterium]|nr:fluoride efflux transporter CrcB [Propionibacteriaceae bacterium]